MKKIILLVLTIILVPTLSAQVPNGTYVPKTDMAKQMPYAKFVFSGSKVNVYLGINGVSLGVAYEYSYTLNGNMLTMKDGAVSVEFDYNKGRDEFSLNMDAAYELLGELGAVFSSMYGKEMSSQQVSNEIKRLVPDVPVWGKEGVPYEPPIVTKQKLAKPEWLQKPPQNAESNKEYQISWKPVSNAKEYRVYITQNGKVLFDSYPTNSSIKIKMPNVTGTVYIGVIAIPTSYDLYEQSDELQATVSISLFSQDIAETCAIYSEKVNNIGIIQPQLKDDGYTAGFAYLYNTSEDGVNFALAHKPVIYNETELAVVIKGTTLDEWYGNMNIGENTERHRSFEQANKEVQQTIVTYMNDYGLNNVSINFLVTGHSRGAAVANLLAVDLNEGKFKISGMKSVVAYTFATPNNSKKTKMYDNIFNFCFEDDFVTQVPLQKWGYGKSGVTYMVSAEKLSNTNMKFKNYSESHNLSFNESATKKGLKDFEWVAPTVYNYYNTQKVLCTITIQDIAQKVYIKPYEFMKDGVAEVKVNGIHIGNPIISAILDFEASSDFLGIALFFVYGSGVTFFLQSYIDDTHKIETYYNALKFNGFNTK